MHSTALPCTGITTTRRDKFATTCAALGPRLHEPFRQLQPLLTHTNTPTDAPIHAPTHTYNHTHISRTVMPSFLYVCAIHSRPTLSPTPSSPTCLATARRGLLPVCEREGGPGPGARREPHGRHVRPVSQTWQQGAREHVAARARPGGGRGGAGTSSPSLNWDERPGNAAVHGGREARHSRRGG